MFCPSNHQVQTPFTSTPAVGTLQTLDLQGLRSLCVPRVIRSDKFKKIVCSCNSSFTNKRLRYGKNRGCLSEPRAVHLEYLPNLKEASFMMHSRRLESLWFYECPDLDRLRPALISMVSKGLRNHRALLELPFHWKTDTVGNFTEDMRVSLMEDAMDLRNLHIVDIVDKKELSVKLECGGFWHLTWGNWSFLTFFNGGR